jgi:hypothetical protein
MPSPTSSAGPDSGTDLGPSAAPGPAGELPLTSLVQALSLGTAAVVVVVGAALVFGLVPTAMHGVVGAGAGAALLANAAAVLLHNRMVDSRPAASFARDAQLMAGRMQSLLAAAFLVKLAVLVVGVVALRQLDAKFDAIAAFAIAFATASLVCQLATAGLLARVLSRRRAGSPAGPGQPRPGEACEARVAVPERNASHDRDTPRATQRP